jgi:predicted negative regulator of RcsB-dependent stress response
MAKNKGTHGKGKVVTDEPDEFVQTVTSLSDRLQPHIKKIVVGVTLIVLVLCAWEFVQWRHEIKAEKATAAYVSALKIVDAPVVAEGDPDPSENRPEKVLSFTTEEERRTASLQALAILGDKHGGIKLSKLAEPREAKLLLSAGKFDEALSAYKKFAASDAPEPLRMTALEGVAYSLEAKAMSNEDPAARQSGLEAALQAFADLQPSEGGPMRDYSLYHQGRVLVALGKPAEGVAMYRKLLTEVPDSSLTSAVEARLESLDTGEE